jgi:uncharacterized protein
MSIHPPYGEVRYRRVIPPGRPWSGTVRQGEVLRIVDLEGEQAVDGLLYAAQNTAERYDAQRTMLAQGQPTVGRGTRLYSNRDRVMMSVLSDSFEGHDTLAGCCSAESNAIRFGEGARYLHACRDNFLIELAKYTMSKRDIVANLNFFMRIRIEQHGHLAIIEGSKEPGHWIDLSAEMDVLCVLSNCPQVNNPANGFNPTPVEVQIMTTYERS